MKMLHRRIVSAAVVAVLLGSAACGNDEQRVEGTVATVGDPKYDYVRASSISGQLESRVPGLDGVFNFIVAADGSYRFERLDGKLLVALHAPSGVVTSIDRRNSVPSVLVSSGRVPAGPDAQSALMAELLGWGYRSSAIHRSASGPSIVAAGRDGELVTATYRGVIDGRVESGSPPLGEVSVETIFDDATALPLRMEKRVGSVSRSSVIVSAIRTNDPVDESLFLPDSSNLAGAYRSQNNLGFKEIAPNVAATDSRFAKAQVPSDYAPAAHYLSQGPTRTYVGTDIATSIYRNGIDTIVVTTRRSESDLDPYAGGNSDLFDGEAESRLIDGPAGKRWNYVSGIGVTPHIWARLSDGRLISAGGDVDLKTLLAIVASL